MITIMMMMNLKNTIFHCSFCFVDFLLLCSGAKKSQKLWGTVQTVTLSTDLSIIIR